MGFTYEELMGGGCILARDVLKVSLRLMEVDPGDVQVPSGSSFIADFRRLFELFLEEFGDPEGYGPSSSPSPSVRDVPSVHLHGG